MKKAVLLLVLAVLFALAGCERYVVGETWEGQRSGGRSIQVSEESPPAGALSGDDVPSSPPEYAFAPALPDGNDPAYRGMLLAAGSRFPEPPVVRRAPPPPPPMPLPVEVTAPPAAPPPAAVVPAPAPGAVVPAVRPMVRPVRPDVIEGQHPAAPRPAAPAGGAAAPRDPAAAPPAVP